MAQTVARYAVTFGLAGCYMPDSHEGCHEFTTRRELADFIRGELEVFELPKAAFAQARIRRVWRFIRRHGSSSAHFTIYHGQNALCFHGLTQDEFATMSQEDF